MNKRSSVVEGCLSIDEVNEHLDELSENIGKGYVKLYAVGSAIDGGLGSDIQARILQRLYDNMTPEEQRWVARVILKGMSTLSLTVQHTHELPRHDYFC